MTSWIRRTSWPNWAGSKLCGSWWRTLADTSWASSWTSSQNHVARYEDNPFWSDPERRRRFFDVDGRTGRHRRFFTVDDLVGVRIEDLDVFDQTHAKIFELVDDGLVDGLRIDHPDGLADPAEYLRRLHTHGAQRIWTEKIPETELSARSGA